MSYIEKYTLQRFYPNAANRTIIDVLKMKEVEDNQLKLSNNIAYSSLRGIKIEKINGEYHHHTHHGIKILSLPKLFD